MGPPYETPMKQCETPHETAPWRDPMKPRYDTAGLHSRKKHGHILERVEILQPGSRLPLRRILPRRELKMNGPETTTESTTDPSQNLLVTSLFFLKKQGPSC